MYALEIWWRGNTWVPFSDVVFDTYAEAREAKRALASDAREPLEARIVGAPSEISVAELAADEPHWIEDAGQLAFNFCHSSPDKR